MRLFFLLTSLFFLFEESSAASSFQSAKKFVNNSKILHAGFAGISFYDPEKDKKELNLNSDKLFIPASNVKLLTLLAAVKYLDSGYVSYKIKKKQDTLFVWGCGDVTLFNEDFLGVSEHPFMDEKFFDINHFILSISNFKDENYGKGWMWDDMTYSYTPYKHPFSINGNKIDVNFDANSMSVSIFPKPIEVYVTFDENFSGGIKRQRFSNDMVINPKQVMKKNRLSYIFRNRHFEAITKDSFNIDLSFDNTVSLTGDEVLYNTVETDTVLKLMAQQSDNFLAEQILYSVGCKMGEPTLNTSLIIKHLKKELFGDRLNQMKWVDGSGLSRYNMLTPNHLIEVLKELRKAVNDDKKLLGYLSAGGVNGTLKKYFRSKNHPYVFAKTGTMTGGFGISGYLKTKRQKLIYFSILTNNNTYETHQIKREIEKLLNLIWLEN